MNWLLFIEAIGGAALFIAVLYWAVNKVAEIAVIKGIKDYEAHLSFDSKKREKAALVAELLSEWAKTPWEAHKVNRLLWEATMWLPDQEAKDLNSLLAHKGDITTTQMILRVKSILQNQPTTLDPVDLTWFADQSKFDQSLQEQRMELFHQLWEYLSKRVGDLELVKTVHIELSNAQHRFHFVFDSEIGAYIDEVLTHGIRQDIAYQVAKFSSDHEKQQKSNEEVGNLYLWFSQEALNIRTRFAPYLQPGNNVKAAVPE